MQLKPMKPAKLDLEKESHQKRLKTYFDSPHYVVEPKLDGCHYINQGGSFISTQRFKDKTGNFPHLVEGFLAAELGLAVLDGEIYYPGTNSFAATKITGCKAPEAIRKQEEELGWIFYCVFDILRDPEGNWLFNHTWYNRREVLEQVFTKLKAVSEYYHIVPVIRRRKQQFLEQELAAGREGVVIKHVNGLYIPGKRPQGNWTKIKIELEDDVVIMGFDPPNKEYTGKDYDNWPYWEDGLPVSKNYYCGLIGSIVFGKYDQTGELHYLGTCSGIDDATRREFSTNSQAYIGRVMKIRAMEKTEEGRYRSPHFVQLHPDKNPEECIVGGV